MASLKLQIAYFSIDTYLLKVTLTFIRDPSVMKSMDIFTIDLYDIRVVLNCFCEFLQFSVTESTIVKRLYFGAA